MSENKDKLVVLWTSGDKEVAMKMVLMYTFNAKLRVWWKDVTLVLWGPSSEILREDEDLQKYIGKIKDAGVELVACRACADEYGVTQKLEELGLDVKHMGEPLTEYLKDDIKILSI